MNRSYVFLAGLVLACVALLAAPNARADGYRPIVREWNVAAPGANTDAITDVTWQTSGPARVTVQAATGTVFNVMVDRGGTEKALGMNSNTALEAGATYTFDVHGLQPGDVINVQVETDSVLDTLAIGEVKGSR